MKKVFLFLLATIQLHNTFASNQMPPDYFDPFTIADDFDTTITFDEPVNAPPFDMPPNSFQPYQPTNGTHYFQPPTSSNATLLDTGYAPFQNQNYICQFCITRCTTPSELAAHEQICIHNPQNLIAPPMQAAQPPQQQSFAFAVPKPTGPKTSKPKSTRTKRKTTSNEQSDEQDELSATIFTDIGTPQPPTPGFEALQNAPKKFLCLQCPTRKDYKNAKALIDHSQIHTSTIKRGNNPNWKYFCGLCGKSFMRPIRLADHLNRHYDIKNFTCPTCSKTFIGKNNLNIHCKKAHHDIKDFICAKCDKRHTTAAKLKKHIHKKHADDMHIDFSTTSISTPCPPTPGFQGLAALSSPSQDSTDDQDSADNNR